MSVAESVETVGKATRLIRFLLIMNFVLFLILLGPGRSHDIDLALRRAGVEDLIVRLLQIWIIGSTAVASVLFTIVAWRRRKTPELKAASPRITPEGVLLLAWWMTVFGSLAYGFMLGLGG
jgi:hypothetical protein